ncbi:MAG: hypothetical protein AMK73_04370 [Planctomycetes bacterium SM23_32]|nr:MAG: hypothetical protein AMK73_04370 [Planctomycetes bacterium SM23_32]
MASDHVDLRPYRRIVEEFQPLERDDVLRLLGAVQDAYGYVPRQIVEDLSARFARPPSQLWGAVTAYPGFRTQPPDESQ